MSGLNLLIGMPSGRGQIAAGTVGSLMALVEVLRDSGIGLRFVCIEAADLIYSRSTMATLVAQRSDFSHLLFIDDDMTFSPDAVLAMLRADKPLIGCICPKRTFSYEKFYNAAREGKPQEIALAESLEFVTKMLPDMRIEIREGLCPVGGIGMAVTLIRRDTLLGMIDKGVVSSRTVAGGRDFLGNDRLYNFFEQIFDESVDALLSEDLSFCHRWRIQCGGEIWALVDQDIGHIGQHVYKGKYIDLLRTGRL